MREWRRPASASSSLPRRIWMQQSREICYSANAAFRPSASSRCIWPPASTSYGPLAPARCAPKSRPKSRSCNSRQVRKPSGLDLTDPAALANFSCKQGSGRLREDRLRYRSLCRCERHAANHQGRRLPRHALPEWDARTCLAHHAGESIEQRSDRGIQGFQP